MLVHQPHLKGPRRDGRHSDLPRPELGSHPLVWRLGASIYGLGAGGRRDRSRRNERRTGWNTRRRRGRRRGRARLVGLLAAAQRRERDGDDQGASRTKPECSRRAHHFARCYSAPGDPSVTGAITPLRLALPRLRRNLRRGRRTRGPDWFRRAHAHRLCRGAAPGHRPAQLAEGCSARPAGARR